MCDTRFKQQSKTLGPTGVCLLLALSSLSQAGDQFAHKQAISEWMRGVPSGCRLVAFDLHAHDSRKLAQQDRVDVVWEYAATADHQETLVLFGDLTVLDAVSDVDGALRVTFALTPDQAQRMRLAACCGKIRIQELSSPDRQARQGWEACGIEDRTEAIEAHLASGSEAPSRLERPTLATHTVRVGKRPCGVITVPVHIELKR